MPAFSKISVDFSLFNISHDNLRKISPVMNYINIKKNRKKIDENSSILP